jgi:hypothetical protein
MAPWLHQPLERAFSVGPKLAVVEEARVVPGMAVELKKHRKENNIRTGFCELGPSPARHLVHQGEKSVDQAEKLQWLIVYDLVSLSLDETSPMTREAGHG